MDRDGQIENSAFQSIHGYRYSDQKENSTFWKILEYGYPGYGLTFLTLTLQTPRTKMSVTVIHSIPAASTLKPTLKRPRDEDEEAGPDITTELVLLGWDAAKKPLYAHQEQGLKQFLEHPEHAMFNWPMGSGKTRGVVLASLLYGSGLGAGLAATEVATSRVVIGVVPVSMVESWKKCYMEELGITAFMLEASPSRAVEKRIDEAREGFPLRVFLTTAEFISSRKVEVRRDSRESARDLVSLLRVRYGVELADIAMVFVDEAHTYRNADTVKRTQLLNLIRLIRSESQEVPLRVLLATGTANFTNTSNLATLVTLAHAGLAPFPEGVVPPRAVHVVRSSELTHLYSHEVHTHFVDAPLAKQHSQAVQHLAAKFVDVARAVTKARQDHNIELVKRLERKLCALKAQMVTILSYGDLGHLLYPGEVKPIEVEELQAKDATLKAAYKQRKVDEEAGVEVVEAPAPAPADSTTLESMTFRKLYETCLDYFVKASDAEKAVLPEACPKIFQVVRMATTTVGRHVAFAARKLTIAAVAAMCQTAGVPAWYLVGDMSSKEREEAIDAWRLAPHGMLVMTYEVGGVGLNLQEGDTVMHMDVPTTQLLKQAEHRVNRPPRTTPVNVYYVNCTLHPEVVKVAGKDGTLDHALRCMSLARTEADSSMMALLQAGKNVDEESANNLSLSTYIQQQHGGFEAPVAPPVTSFNPVVHDDPTAVFSSSPVEFVVDLSM